RRSPYEAMDLGLTMLQRWWRRVYLPHLLFAVPLMAGAFGVGWWLERAWVALLIIWWLKPAYDRVVLHVLSRAVFGELPTTRAVFGAAKEWLGTGLVLALVLRPSLARSFNLPVRQLEGQSGRAGRERRAVLGRRVSGYATSLTLTCLAIEVFVLSSSFGLLTELFMPAKASEGTDFFQMVFGSGGDEGSFIGFDDALAYGAAVLVLEPFYVAAGFGLYLNRRTMLEGWDIEVALRRIAARHAAAIIVAVVMAFGSIPPPAYAQEKDPRKEIAEVLKAKEFGYYKDVKRWQSREQPGKPGKSWFDWSWLPGVGYALARAGEVLLWLGAGALLAYALWWASRMLPRYRGPPPEPYRPPAALFGMDLAPEKLPADVGAAAAALAREGKLREALGLLYRGALSELVHRRGVQLLASHTEGEAVRVAQSKVSAPTGSYLQSLVGAWQQCAYARRMPRADDVVRLADDYRGAFA
ncbi:MAG TPA: hypothetical protein VFU24_04020, partial [Burkholderiales bacterium]|nr:hypothetical protein [Burkholderiales bacterium]